VPAVVLLAGSGSLDRDETIGRNKPLKDIAWGLASRGIAVVRFDKVTYTHATELATAQDITLDSEYLPQAIAAIPATRGARRLDRYQRAGDGERAPASVPLRNRLRSDPGRGAADHRRHDCPGHRRQQADWPQFGAALAVVTGGVVAAFVGPGGAWLAAGITLCFAVLAYAATTGKRQRRS
jgi:hypothetical protein